MTIAIDFDNTWTADVALWRAFAADAKARGHDVVIVTARSGWSDDMERHHAYACPCFYTAGMLKRVFMDAIMRPVDVWIDDEPGTIERCRKLDDASDADI